MVAKKLQVKLHDEWRYVFAYNMHEAEPIIITSMKEKALDCHALKFFEEHFADHEFRCEPIKAKGWREVADESGKAPEHVIAANKRKTESISRAPMQLSQLEPWQMTLKEYWATKFNGSIGDSFSKKNIEHELNNHYKVLLEDVKSGKVRPSRVVGTGYKYPKKAAIDWLESKIQTLQDIVDGKAMDEIAVSNHAFHVQKAFREGKPIPPKVLAQYPKLG